MALLPMLILFAFALITFLPSLFGSMSDPDPRFAFEQKGDLDTARSTWQRGVPYFVNAPEFEKSAVWQHVPEARRGDVNAASSSHKLRQFERGVEGAYIRRLQNEVSRQWLTPGGWH
jgi:DnaJ family protein B protein 12